ncbi:hypothetical protein MY10362_004475 [Beauveria mimosiformis]
MATFIRVPGRQDPKANIFQLVRDWLQEERKGPWVVILDNVDDSSFLKKPSPNIDGAVTAINDAYSRELISYIPSCQHRSVLITSRSRGAALQLVKHANIIAVKPMNKKDTLRLFQNKLGQNDDETYTIKLAAALEYMPLAIVQAAAYVLQMRPRYSLQSYLAEFRKSDRRKARLLSSKGGELRRDAQAKNSILITWQISFDYIRETRPSAADLLSFMSFCDRQGIPEILLRGQINDVSGKDEQSKPDAEYHLGAEDKLNDSADDDESSNSGNDSDSDLTEQQSNYSANESFENDIVTLRNFYFIIADEDGTTFEMHRLVQIATLEWLRAQDIYEQWRHRFLVKLCAEMPTGRYEDWGKCQTLFPHARSVSSERPATNDSIREWATILYRAAWFALEKGKGKEAENLSVQAMKARKRIFDGDHEDVTWSKVLVASAYRLRGHLSKAERLQVQVIATLKTTLGEDHRSTLASTGNLASTYSYQGRWVEAARLQVQVMEAFERKPGEDCHDTLTSMNNLASTYSNLGWLGEAEKLQVQVMETSKTKLGADHPDTLTSMGNLASTYSDQGRWGEAERLQVPVVEKLRTKLGEDHPLTLASMGNLASTYSNQGRWIEAERLQMQVMETSKIKLGGDHSYTLTSMSYLSSIYSNQGRWDEAEKLEVQVMETCKAKLGADHPDTLTSMGNLASIYSGQGRYDKAERLQAQVLEMFRTKFGEDHPSTLASMSSLAWIYWESARSKEAKTLMRLCVKLARVKLGASHPHYLSAAKALASWER